MMFCYMNILFVLLGAILCLNVYKWVYTIDSIVDLPIVYYAIACVLPTVYYYET